MPTHTFSDRVPSDTEAAEMLRFICDNRPPGTDEEQLHKDADEFLCALLSSLGYTETVRVFIGIQKWYA